MKDNVLSTRLRANPTRLRSLEGKECYKFKKNTHSTTYEDQRWTCPDNAQQARSKPDLWELL